MFNPEVCIKINSLSKYSSVTSVIDIELSQKNHLLEASLSKKNLKSFQRQQQYGSSHVP